MLGIKWGYIHFSLLYRGIVILLKSVCHNNGKEEQTPQRRWQCIQTKCQGEMTGDNGYTGGPNEEGRAWTNYDWLLVNERRRNDYVLMMMMTMNLTKHLQMVHLKTLRHSRVRSARTRPYLDVII